MILRLAALLAMLLAAVPAAAGISAGRVDDFGVVQWDETLDRLVRHNEISWASRVEIPLRFLSPPRKGAHGR